MENNERYAALGKAQNFLKESQRLSFTKTDFVERAQKADVLVKELDKMYKDLKLMPDIDETHGIFDKIAVTKRALRNLQGVFETIALKKDKVDRRKIIEDHGEEYSENAAKMDSALNSLMKSLNKIEDNTMSFEDEVDDDIVFTLEDLEDGS